MATIITPYVLSTFGLGNGLAYGPLLFDELGVLPGMDDVTKRPMANGIPATNLYLIELPLSGPQLAQVKSDNRFFVLEPGPGYSGSALATWLDGKGANGHGVSGEDTAEQARAKVINYCRNL